MLEPIITLLMSGITIEIFLIVITISIERSKRI